MHLSTQLQITAIRTQDKAHSITSKLQYSLMSTVHSKQYSTLYSTQHSTPHTHSVDAWVHQRHIMTVLQYSLMSTVHSTQYSTLHTHSVDVWVHQSHVIIARYAVSESRQPLLDSLHHHRVREGVPDVEELCSTGKGTGKQRHRLMTASLGCTD